MTKQTCMLAKIGDRWAYHWWLDDTNLGWRWCSPEVLTREEAIADLPQGARLVGPQLDGLPPGYRIPSTGADEVGRPNTCGSIDDSDLCISWGGACPVQGDGFADETEIYYRSRGGGWSVTFGADEWEFGERCYIFPDGGWVSAVESESNIQRAVAAWKIHKATETAQ